MTFVDLAANDSIFLDANTLVYHFGPHPRFGAACHALIQRIENHELRGFTSTHVVSEVAHKLMVEEASLRFGWTSKVIGHLKHTPSAIQSLTTFCQAVAKIPQYGIQILLIPEAIAITPPFSVSDTAFSQTTPSSSLSCSNIA
jgi:hypothetical protein